MKQILGLAVGIAVGALIGVGLVVAFAPVSGRKFRDALDEGYQNTLEDARSAAARKRGELEAQYKRLTTK